MRRYLNILFLLLTIATVACQEQAHEHGEAVETTYTCPMHPQIVQSEPGSCPVCGMDLVSLSGPGEPMERTEDLSYLLRPANSTIISSIATVEPEYKSMQTSLEMEGIITYDPRRVYNIPARIAGRIEKLYVTYNNQPISKGQKLMEIYSPELVTAQQELLYLVKNSPEDVQLIAAAKQKLSFLGATQAQINRLIRTGEASYTFALYSPYDGYVTELNTEAPTATISLPSRTGTSGGGMDAMGGGSTQGMSSRSSAVTGSMQNQRIQLREGMYVNTGQTLFRVVNTDQLWAEFNVPAGEINSLAKGAPVQITFPQIPGEHLQATVDLVQPYFEAGENFAKVRVYLTGQQKLAMVGQLVKGRASYATDSALWIPREAVLDLGTQSVAFRKVNSVFEPVVVTTGTTEERQVQVLSGLQQGEAIAANAQFLVDSESFVKVNRE
ncbi:efflux RND transporter periplasmic adaptor subunit [Pontibacter harenae]|uniref:efflux RND transporter periplasmic adaptor subunit n=1 Tax=Pontibacter harenae TaxID=2894083 RepID=UPI001E3DE584|nr:efflux RND transporter periplasmic adaptor subunit [Pontibacter harenae]MCC9167437.1 efflux RND transporter periplasmic adaptor subunit [Pontibacter harenae]